MAKQKGTKTNAVRLVEQQKINYNLIEYSIEESHVDGVTVANKVGYPVHHVFKTLVATAGTGKFFVFVIPVAEELNLKACAKVAGEKKIEMLHVKDLLSTTGYIRGGCSPIGMKKLFPTFIEETAADLDYIIVSAGKIGMQIQLNPNDLIHVTSGKFAKLTV
ncbi:Cys-tRNA(Pro) deacylase [Lysinibacillus sp. SGAir0095]|uniref:Cys-tRNA(Pro) deacylase n=1 Tax=Lysinibacillus sp. SGAir0095 TaxID=2070463 RepID=UPI0010CD475E|nr:Cys-tRNA(Pro) deacylase [Lysinibacillus sp. SGAir0095]QCR31339.1 Cys-tRNA(Pro) deacylase [Lysinibacillus sp. SGAir0095]